MSENQAETKPVAFPLELLRSAPLESRNWLRYPCHLPGVCWPVTHPATSDLMPAHLIDLSATGMGLLLECCPAPGTFLVVQAGDETSEASWTMIGRVVRTVAQGEGRWMVGCSLVGKLMQATSKASIEYGIGGILENGRDEAPAAAARRREVLDEVKKQIREQLQELTNARDTLTAEKVAGEQRLHERWLQLERHAEELASRRTELEALEARVSEQFDQAIPERVPVAGQSGTDFPAAHDTRVGLHSARIERLEAERDAALAEVRKLQEQAATWAAQKDSLEMQQRKLASERARLQKEERELHLLQVETRESFDIAERENHRLRAELAEERRYLARQREALRLEKAGHPVVARASANATARAAAADAARPVCRGTATIL